MTELVASILAASVEDAIERGRRALRKGADRVEFRIDLLPGPEDVTRLIREAAMPCIVACRIPDDGGRFDGDLDARRRMLLAAAAAGADWIDLEHWEALSLPADLEVKVLRSYHRLNSVPRDLVRIVERMAATRPNAIKVTLRAYDAADLDIVGGLYRRDFGSPLAAFLAGEPGFASRFLAVACGSPFVYCRADGDAATAPGQPDLFEARQLYRAATLATHGAFWGLAGSPVAHSLGVRLHNHLARYADAIPTYLPFDTREPERLLDALRVHGAAFRGLSVTAPLKRSFLPFCDSLSEEGEACGAINTLIHDGERMRGENTDVYGVRMALLDAGVPQGDFAGQRGLVIGGGGSARAAVLALQQLGAEVTLAVRSRQHIRGFAEGRGVPLVPIDAKSLASVAPQIIVHATPVGQGDRRGADGDCLLGARSFDPEMLVVDLVYAPVWTPLLERARAAGCRAVTGLAMFLHQAREQMRLVLGMEPPEVASLRPLLGPVGRASFGTHDDRGVPS